MFISGFITEVRRKFKHIFLVVIFSLSVCIYLYANAAEEWKSKALLITPTYAQTSSLFSILSNIASVDNVNIENINNDYIFQQFINELDNIDNKRNYLKSIGFDTEQLSQLGIEKKIRVVVIPDKDKKIAEISFVSSSAVKAKDDLEGYLEYINTLVNMMFVRHVESVIDSIMTSLKVKEDVVISTAKHKLNNKKNELNISIEITKKAGQNNPVSDPGFDVELPITLGYNLLNNQLKEYQKNSYNVFLDNSELRSKLEVLKTIKSDKIDIESFKYQGKPELPEYKSSPSLIKYVIISLFFSIVVSMFVVLFGIRNTIIEKLK
ncbi:hypothetical protein [Aeromonas enteropelogenes]|uniref:Polysaccharide chain length determinant N-terminal domain-containing protein n=1 Tax=Aeromonas enteropelogenes TaxID=29489 RepID=A0A175VM91_AEREN|nr:hypothetical protein [Aeromonas enteropelogenes]KXU81623.1 hypothetical protein LCR_07950 [Aeromonas enteropelogenes]